MAITVDEILAHHGVKGQKWGIRHEPIRASGASTKHPASKIKVDETPWSNYKESMYSGEQWHNACLIHNHSGTPTAKAQCKLPIKTPNGVVNRHGVYSAASVLAGGRGGVFATSAQKNSAARSLIHIYGQMGVTPPPSLKLKHGEEFVSNFLEHVGVKGMHWGIHTEKDWKEGGGGRKSAPSVDARTAYALKKRPVHTLTNKQVKTVTTRMGLEQQFRRVNPKAHEVGKKRAEEILAIAGIATSAYALFTSPLGKHMINLGRKAAPKQLKLF